MRPLTAILLAFLICSSGFSQETKQPDENIFKLNGNVREVAFFGGNSPEGSLLMTEFALKGGMEYQQAIIFSDIRIRMGEALGEKLDILNLKELYAGFKSEKFDILAGEQIRVWGRTDGFSPNDYLNSSDYFFLTPDQDDQRLPSLILSAAFRFNPSLSIELLALPKYRPSVYRYELFDMGDNVSFTDVLLPEKKWENGSLAGRLNIDLPSIGISIYGFRGYSPFFGFTVDTVDWGGGYPQISYTPEPYQHIALGTDFDLLLGSMIFRGDLAYKMTDGYETRMNVPNTQLDYVFSLEYMISTVSIVGQYIGKYVNDFRELTEPQLLDPANPLAQLAYGTEMTNYESTLFNRKVFHQQEEMNHAISLILSGQFFYNVLDIDLAGYYNLTSEEYLIRPMLAWHVTDHLEFAIGGNIIGGPEKTPFDYSGTVMNGVFTELKATF